MFIDFVLKNYSFETLYQRNVDENWLRRYVVYNINKGSLCGKVETFDYQIKRKSCVRYRLIMLKGIQKLFLNVYVLQQLK